MISLDYDCILDWASKCPSRVTLTIMKLVGEECFTSDD